MSFATTGHLSPDEMARLRAGLGFTLSNPREMEDHLKTCSSPCGKLENAPDFQRTVNAYAYGRAMADAVEDDLEFDEDDD